MVRYIYPEERAPVFYPAFRSGEVTRRLILANVLVFFLEISGGLKFTYLFGLTPHLTIQNGMIWQLITYMFLHGGVAHLFFNMLVLWMFGRELEERWGARRFLTFYFFTGIGAGITALLFYWDSSVPIIGASGAIFGLLLAYGVTFPFREILLFFLFPIQARYFVILAGILELINVTTASQAGIANFAHLGGMLFGYLFLHYEQHFLMWFATQKNKAVRKSEFQAVARRLDRSHVGQQVDRILDKIREEGMSGLTQEEWEILKSARDL